MPGPGRGEVDQLAVRAAWRRRGLGAALLVHAFHALRDRGFERVVLGVDAENTTGALGLYERVGMRVQYSFDFFEKPLASR
jgi:ribosomal protein S18 acetylase RimI-like enzyme